MTGLAMGNAIPALFQTTMARVATQDAGAGSGALQTFQQIGFVVSIALIGQLFFSRLGDVSSADASHYVAAAKGALSLPLAVALILVLHSLWQLFRVTK